MPAVNWDQPSDGSVSDPAPSLLLRNDKGGALMARSRGDAVDATSKGAHAINARTRKTLTARVESAEFVALLARAPMSTAAIGGNEVGLVAVAGVNLPRRPWRPYRSGWRPSACSSPGDPWTCP